MTYEQGIEFAAMDAIDDGVEANERGLPLEANPHWAGTRLYNAWADGWNSFLPCRIEWENNNPL